MGSLPFPGIFEIRNPAHTWPLTANSLAIPPSRPGYESVTLGSQAQFSTNPGARPSNQATSQAYTHVGQPKHRDLPRICLGTAFWLAALSSPESKKSSVVPLRHTQYLFHVLLGASSIFFFLWISQFFTTSHLQHDRIVQQGFNKLMHDHTLVIFGV